MGRLSMKAHCALCWLRAPARGSTVCMGRPSALALGIAQALALGIAQAMNVRCVHTRLW